eukprot:NODE_738_length_4687_cov_0.308849.p6 type:complete len:137 gc:universal NODE_738_length_4687_cov_0.308849:2970-3380(+)
MAYAAWKVHTPGSNATIFAGASACFSHCTSRVIVEYHLFIPDLYTISVDALWYIRGSFETNVLFPHFVGKGLGGRPFFPLPVISLVLNCILCDLAFLDLNLNENLCDGLSTFLRDWIQVPFGNLDMQPDEYLQAYI